MAFPIFGFTTQQKVSFVVSESGMLSGGKKKNIWLLLNARACSKLHFVCLDNETNLPVVSTVPVGLMANRILPFSVGWRVGAWP